LITIHSDMPVTATKNIALSEILSHSHIIVAAPRASATCAPPGNIGRPQELDNCE